MPRTYQQNTAIADNPDNQKLIADLAKRVALTYQSLKTMEGKPNPLRQTTPKVLAKREEFGSLILNQPSNSGWFKFRDIGIFLLATFDDVDETFDTTKCKQYLTMTWDMLVGITEEDLKGD